MVLLADLEDDLGINVWVALQHTLNVVLTGYQVFSLSVEKTDLFGTENVVAVVIVVVRPNPLNRSRSFEKARNFVSFCRGYVPVYVVIIAILVKVEYWRLAVVHGVSKLVYLLKMVFLTRAAIERVPRSLDAAVALPQLFPLALTQKLTVLAGKLKVWEAEPARQVRVLV